MHQTFTGINPLIDSLLRARKGQSKPFIIGITGSVAIGKSSFARVLRESLLNAPEHPTVEIISTDGFLYPSQTLHSQNLMKKKGFPESFDQAKLIQFIQEIKSGVKEIKIPVYSHDTYDLTGEILSLTLPEIVILEGVNAKILTDKSLVDYSIYLDAPTGFLENRYLERFKQFRHQAKDRTDSFFHPYTLMNEAQALNIARHTWKTINEVNLNENILPFKERADYVLDCSEEQKCRGCFCGDRSRAKSIPTKIAVVLFGLPLFSTVIGASIGLYFSEMYSIVGAALGLVFSFFALRTCQRWLNRLS